MEDIARHGRSGDGVPHFQAHVSGFKGRAHLLQIPNSGGPVSKRTKPLALASCKVGPQPIATCDDFLDYFKAVSESVPIVLCWYAFD